MCRKTSKKTSNRTICALIAGLITALGVTGLFTVSDKSAQASQSNSRPSSTGGVENTGGWYTNKALRGRAMHKRIFKYLG